MHCQCFLKEHRTIQELQFAQENDPFFYYMASLKMSKFVKLHEKIKKYKNFHLPTSQWIVFKSYSNSFFYFGWEIGLNELVFDPLIIKFIS